MGGMHLLKEEKKSEYPMAGSRSYLGNHGVHGLFDDDVVATAIGSVDDNKYFLEQNTIVMIDMMVIMILMLKMLKW